MNDHISQLPAVIPFLWIGGLVAASIIYRRSRGKPVLFFTVPNASFIERSASGRSHRNWYSQLGGGNNCLVVAISQGKLVVRPFFPFNLMFLAEMFGLEQEIPLEQIKSIEIKKTFFTKGLLLKYRDMNGEGQSMTLTLRRRDEFLAALPASVQIINNERPA